MPRLPENVAAPGGRPVGGGDGSGRFEVQWFDSGYEPQEKPNPAYPHGMDLDGANRAMPYCSTKLPYPAKRCGQYFARCLICGLTASLGTGPRPHDPRSFTVNCKPMARV